MFNIYVYSCYYFYKATMSLVGIDLWVLLKTRRFTKFIIKLLSLLFKTVFLMALGAGLLITYTLATAKNKINSPIYVTTDDEYSYNRLKTGNDRLLSMETVQIAESIILEGKLESMKNQAKNLELNLKKMETQYKDLAKIVPRVRRDEELADFASEAGGGSVLDTPDTESYYEPWHQQITLFGIPIWKANYFTPRKVIQPWTQAGECWAFKGSWGKITIELAYPILINQITLEHIPLSVSLTRSIDSAPKDFTVYGLIDRKFVKLDSFTYDIDGGESSQTFKLKETEDTKLHAIKIILIEINSNWGHRDYTCVYRFRVHGKISELSEENRGIYID